MDKVIKITYTIQNIGVFLIVLGIFPFIPERITDIGFFIGVAALLFRIVKIRQKPDFLKLKNWWPLIGMLGYVMILIAVSQFSPTVRQSSHVAYNYFKYMRAAFEVALLMNQNNFFSKSVFYGLAIGTIGICLGPDNMIFQYFHNQQYYQYDLHRNMIANIFILMIPCAILYLTHYAQYLLEKLGCIAFILLCCFTLFCTESRGAVSALSISGLIFAGAYCIQKEINKKNILIGGIIAFVFINSAFSLVPEDNHLVDMKRAMQFTSTSIDSYSERNRIYLYQGTWNMIKDHPIIGVGLDNFNKEYVAHYMVKSAVEKDLPHAHNFILAILSTTGIIGLLGFAFMEGQFFHFFFKRCYNMNAFIGLFCLLVLLIHDFVDYSLSVYLICKLYWLILLFCYCMASIEKKK